MDTGAKGGKERGLIAEYALLIKIALAAAAVAAAVWGMHLYNDMRREEGRKEVRAEWTAATKEQQDAFDAERRRLTKARDNLSTQFNAERTARLETEKQLGAEREEAIRNSGVAGNVCFDERMRDQWNRDSGRSGAGEARPRVDAAMPDRAVGAEGSDGR